MRSYRLSIAWRFPQHGDLIEWSIHKSFFCHSCSAFRPATISIQPYQESIIVRRVVPSVHPTVPARNARQQQGEEAALPRHVNQLWISACSRCPSRGSATWEDIMDTSRQMLALPSSTIHRRMPIRDWQCDASEAFSSGVTSSSGRHTVLIAMR